MLLRRLWTRRPITCEVARLNVLSDTGSDEIHALALHSSAAAVTFRPHEMLMGAAVSVTLPDILHLSAIVLNITTKTLIMLAVFLASAAMQHCMSCRLCATDCAPFGWPSRFHLYPDGMFSHVPGRMPRAGEGEGTVAFTWGGKMGCEQLLAGSACRSWPRLHK